MRVALITGAGSGLGRAMALELTRLQDWHVIITDINVDAANETLELVSEAGGTGQVESLNVCQPEEWEGLRQRLQDQHERLHLLVNNAGVVASGRVDALPLRDFDWTFNINTRGALIGIQAMLPWLKTHTSKASPAHILNVASICGLLMPPNLAAYNCAKAATIALSETLACELLHDHISVTVACPGFFQTNLLESGRFVHASERAAGERFTVSSPLNAQRVAREALQATLRRQLHAVIGPKARRLWLFKRLLPGWFHWLKHFVAKRSTFRDVELDR